VEWVSENHSWWCPICEQIVEPSWLEPPHRGAYHRFGGPPFVARHGLIPYRHSHADPGIVSRLVASAGGR
jgi:hypothetical protein